MHTVGTVLFVAIGLLLIAINAKKLLGDWRRMKPRHNVDLAFIQIILGVILLAVAWYVGRDSGG